MENLSVYLAMINLQRLVPFLNDQTVTRVTY